MPPLATPADLDKWLGATVDEARATLILDQASGVVRQAASQTWVTTDDPPELATNVPAVAVTITLTVAARMLANPVGATSQTAGPFSMGMAAQFLTEDERETLGSFRRNGGLWTVSTTRGRLETADVRDDVVFVPTVYSGTNQPGETIITDRR